MAQFPLVSIAICIYNGERYLKEQLDSIFNQDYKHIEVIAVDDCSRDRSREILAEYAGQHPNLKVYHNTSNLGYVKNFEKAIALSSGAYIALSDHDDIWHPQKISKQIAAIPGHLLVYHDSQYIDDNGKNLNLKMSDILNLIEGTNPIPFVLKNCVSGHTILFDRKLIKHAFPLNPSFFHDWWLAFIAANEGSIKLVPEVLVQYRQHVNNTIDMLNIREDEEKEKFYNPLVSDRDWVKHCSSYEGSYKQLIAKIYYLINNTTFINKLKLYFLLYKNISLFFAINKGARKHKVRDLKKMVFSLKKSGQS